VHEALAFEQAKMIGTIAGTITESSRNAPYTAVDCAAQAGKGADDTKGNQACDHCVLNGRKPFDVMN